MAGVTSDRVATALTQFIESREWSQFHSPKNLAMALAAEAGELLAEFQWLTQEESEKANDDGDLRQRVSMELADVAIYLRLLADRLNVDLDDVVLQKIAINEARFPPAD